MDSEEEAGSSSPPPLSSPPPESLDDFDATPDEAEDYSAFDTDPDSYDIDDINSHYGLEDESDGDMNDFLGPLSDLAAQIFPPLHDRDGLEHIGGHALDHYSESGEEYDASVINLEDMSELDEEDRLDWDGPSSQSSHDLGEHLDEGDLSTVSDGPDSSHDSPSATNSPNESLFDDDGFPSDFGDELHFHDDVLDFDDDFRDTPEGHLEAPFSPIERLINRFQSEVEDLTESVRELRQRVEGGGESSRPGATRGSASRESRDHPTRQGSPYHHNFARLSRTFHPYSRNHHRTAADDARDRHTPRASAGPFNLPPFPPRSQAERSGPDHVLREIIRGSSSPNNMADELHEVVFERRRSVPRQAAAPTVIDLTNSDDDEPEVRAMPPPPNRNPRRQSQIRRTPSLARSDGSLLGGAPVIDLTGDDLPPLPPPPPPAPRHNHGPNRQHNPRRLPRIGALDHIDLALDEDEDDGLHPGGAFFDIFRNFGGGADGRFFIGGGIGLLHRLGGQVFGHQPAEVDVQFIGQNIRMDNPAANPLANNAPNFNYGANGYNNPAANDKPPYVPPPPAEPGFTRNTGEDLTVICPSCEEELAYDPDEEQAPPSKKARTKKDQEEHHFWAVKECGHVFCRSCYENRTKPDKTTFRPAEGSSGSRKQVLCGVEDCPAIVTNKSAWVGLFV